MDAEALKLAIESLDGDFELIRELGRGATAVVYLLRDHGLDRDVALKVIRGGYGTDEEAVARLQREAHLVAQLQHPNIVKLFGTHRLPDRSFALLMEHVPGRNLKEILNKEGALPVPRVLEILKDVASALAYAHRRRIVHRDVKPENIYIDEEVGAARLADFGVARPWDQDSRLTIPGASLGTPAYMSPEQIDGKEVDGRSDVYSLGLVGYEIILGRHPWEGENVFSTIFKQKNETLSLDLPALERFPALSEVLRRALEKDPQARWKSADVFLKQLQEVAPKRRKDDPASEDLVPRRSHAPAEFSFDVSEEPEQVDTSGADQTEEELPPVDWLNFEEATESTLLPVALPGQDDSAPPSQSPVVVRRKKRSFFRWVALAVILIGGSLGVYGWLLSPDGFSFLDRRSPTRSAPGPGPASGPSAPERPASAASLLVLTGANAEGPVGSSVPLTTRASGLDGTPMADTLVQFQIVEGEGSLDIEEVRTGEDGLAATTLRLPNRAGRVVVRGVLSGVQETEVRFDVSAQPGPPREVTTIVGNGQTGPPGEVLPEFIGIRVWDEFGNLVPNAQVLFRILEGEGQVQPNETFTDDVGRAFARWTLGTSTGVQTAAATVPGTQDTLLTFEAMAEMPAPLVQETEIPTPPPAPVSARVRSQPLAIGGSHVCSLTGGTALCRGGTDRGQGGGGSVEGLRALAAGVSHGCGLQRDGTAWCWGANESGQLGDSSREDRRSAVAVVTESSFSVLVGGLSHTCGLDGRGTASCWGRNLNGQLGDGTRTDRGQPIQVAGDVLFESLTSGWNHTCGLTSTGRAYCWGLNGEGQIGDGTRIDRLTPTPVRGVFHALVAGAGHTCGISGDGVSCWGDNGFGQLGDGGDTRDQSLPVPVLGLPTPPTALAAGAVHTCALLEDGSAYCWGQNLHGQLGDGTTQNSAIPVAVAGDLRFATLFAGGGVTCGYLADGSEYCWGMNQVGQLGDGSRTNRSSPVRLGGR